MAETAATRWYRASHPLQASTKSSTSDASTMSAGLSSQAGSPGSAAATKIRSISPDGAFSSLPRLPEAVNGISKYSVMSQLGNDASFALRKSIDDILASSEASTVVARSTYDPSPPSSSSSQHHPSANESPNGSISEQYKLEHQRTPPVSSRAWVRGSYPLHAGAASEQTRSHEHAPSTPKALRRAPGTDQLRIDTLDTEGALNADATVQSSTHYDDMSSALEPASAPDTSVARSPSRWKRQRYPTQSTALNDYSQLATNIPQVAGAGSEVLSNSSSTQNERLDSEPSLVCPMGHQSAMPDTEQHTPRVLDDMNASADTATPMIEQSRGRRRLKSSFSRQTYPLQTAASIINLRDAPSPSRSSTDAGVEWSSTTASQAPKPPSYKKRSRGIYPLHSPPSVVQLRAPPSPPSSSDGDQESTTTPTAGQPVEQSSPRQQNKRSRRRIGYPLQNSASFAELRSSAEPLPARAEQSTSGAALEHADTPAQHFAAREEQNRFRQRGYPLQPRGRPLPAVYTSLQPLPLEAKVTEPGQSIVDSPPESPTTSGQSKYARRGSYPLSSQPSIPALQFSPPTPPSEDDAHTEPTVTHPEPSTDPSASRAEELATKVLRQWRRPSYPPRDLSSNPHDRNTLTPKPSSESLTRSPSPSPRLLPKNLRAVRDSTLTTPCTATHSHRTIIVCLDGTGDKFDNDNSNIVHLVSALKKDDPHQVSYYQAGIGTYTTHGLNTGFSAAMDMAVGSELGLHVRDAYQFLMHSYKEGDKICIFGFSRGAYTARCLAGMVHKVGLLPPRNLQQIYFAYQFYADDSAAGWEASNAFKATFSIDVSVYFLGCFDSVASVGFVPRQLPLSTTPTNKCWFFRHAMALDERRAKFKVCRYQKVDWDDVQMGTTEGLEGKMQFDSGDDEGQVSWGKAHKKYGPDWHPNVTDEEYERLEEPDVPKDTDVKEVWFAGCHADIGGGAVANDERHKLAQIPLRWMIRQAFECNTGIRFKTKKLAEFGIDVHTLWPQYRSLSEPSHGPPPSFLEKFDPKTGLPPKSVRRGKLVPTEEFDGDGGERLYALKSHKDEDWTPEQMEDWYDAMQPLNDQLVQAPNWWLLELWPVQYKVPIAPGEIITRTGMNLGRYRGVGDVEPLLHWTVVQRCQYLGYEIKVRTAPHTRWKVVV